MMKTLNFLAAVLFACVLTACGGSGGAGTSAFTGAPGPTTTSQAASVDVLASNVQLGSGGDQVKITAIVKDASNVGLASAPVAFATDSGTLTSAATKTDASGTATAMLAAGSDKSNRSITVVVTSGSVTGKVSVQVTGTTITYSGVTTLLLGGTTTMAVQALDSKGVPVANLPITAASSLANGFSATALTTDALGNASATYTAANAGTDSVSFVGGGTTATAKVLISAANFSFISPDANTRVAVGTTQAVKVRYLSGGTPRANAVVNFSATAGTVSPVQATTDASGVATVNISSSSAASAVLQATLADGTAQATLPLTFVATVPSRAVIQVSPTAIGPNASGTTTQQARVLVTVTDANGNPVSGRTVTFTRVADPSGGTLSQASATTDLTGQATVQYIAGPLATPSNGVQIQASVQGTSVMSATVGLTVNQSALFIALGTGNTIQNLDPQTYKKDWVVYVTDANGVAVANTQLTMSLLPLAYGKGSLAWSGTSWVRTAANPVCPNEDTDYSGTYTAAKDTNGNGRLDPGNVISVSTNGGSTSASNGTVTTDSAGRATISIIYAESYAPWVQVALRAQAVVAGTESSTSSTFWVSGAASDFTDQNVPPAGLNSPFGLNSCASPN